jgi:enoyl-CoA hydratase/carnithine racemase
MADILLTEKQGHICTLYINRPERKNGLNFEIFSRLYDAIETANKDEEIRVIIIRGTGERVFSNGIDLGDEVRKGRNPESLRENIYDFNNAIERTGQIIASGRCPVIAMIYGDCLASALDLAVSCDLRVASDISRFSLYTVSLGHVFQYQGIQRLVNLIGPGYAKEILLTGRIIEAPRAKEMGLVNYLVPVKDVYSTTISLANDIAEKAPLAVSGTKETIYRLLKSQQQPDAMEQATFQNIFNTCVQSEDAREGPKALIEGRKPRFTGK